MNKQIIALQGKGNSGKSSTIRILHGLLIKNGYTMVKSNFNGIDGDFVAEFSKAGLLIGITSQGDTYLYVHAHLKELIDDGCQICVCACRSFDRVPPGTNGAIKEFTEFNSQFISKTRNEDENLHLSINTKDAQELLVKIELVISDSVEVLV